MAEFVCIDKDGKGWTDEEFLRENLHRYGLFKQMTKLNEELAELQVEISKCINQSIDNQGRPIVCSNIEHISEEMADCLIVGTQVMNGLGLGNKVNEWKRTKMRRQILERWE